MYLSEEYLRYQEKAISIEIENGNIHQAALHLKQAAEACEGQGNFDKAIEHYQQAKDFFEMETQKRFSLFIPFHPLSLNNIHNSSPFLGFSSVQACQTQLALIYSLHKAEYERAAEIYEELAVCVILFSLSLSLFISFTVG